MLIDENGIPCIVQRIIYLRPLCCYRVYYFDGNYTVLFAERLSNHHQVTYAKNKWNVVDYSPLIPELENLWFIFNKDPLLWKEFG